MVSILYSNFELYPFGFPPFGRPDRGDGRCCMSFARPDSNQLGARHSPADREMRFSQLVVTAITPQSSTPMDSDRQACRTLAFDSHVLKWRRIWGKLDRKGYSGVD